MPSAKCQRQCVLPCLRFRLRLISHPEGPPLSRAPSPACSAVGETILYVCRIALAAWPLLVLTVVLIVSSVGLQLYQTGIQVRGSSEPAPPAALSLSLLSLTRGLWRAATGWRN